MEIQELNCLVRDEYDVIREKIDDALQFVIDAYFLFYKSDDVYLEPVYKQKRTSIEISGGRTIDVTKPDASKRPAEFRIMFFGREMGKFRIYREQDDPNIYRVRIISLIRAENVIAEMAVDKNDPHSRPKSLRLDSETNASALMNRFISTVERGFQPISNRTKDSKRGKDPDALSVFVSKCIFEPDFYKNYFPGYIEDDISEKEKKKKIKEYWLHRKYDVTDIKALKEKPGSYYESARRTWSRISTGGEGFGYFNKYKDHYSINDLMNELIAYQPIAPIA